MKHHPDYTPATEIPQLEHEHDVMVREAHIASFHKLEIIACNTYWKKVLAKEIEIVFWRGARVGLLFTMAVGMAILLLTRP
jgi:hypothetical protein